MTERLNSYCQFLQYRTTLVVWSLNDHLLSPTPLFSGPQTFTRVFDRSRFIDYDSFVQIVEALHRHHIDVELVFKSPWPRSSLGDAWSNTPLATYLTIPSVSSGDFMIPVRIEYPSGTESDQTWRSTAIVIRELLSRYKMGFPTHNQVSPSSVLFFAQKQQYREILDARNEGVRVHTILGERIGIADLRQSMWNSVADGIAMPDPEKRVSLETSFGRPSQAVAQLVVFGFDDLVLADKTLAASIESPDGVDARSNPLLDMSSVDHFVRIVSMLVQRKIQVAVTSASGTSDVIHRWLSFAFRTQQHPFVGRIYTLREIANPHRFKEPTHEDLFRTASLETNVPVSNVLVVDSVHYANIARQMCMIAIPCHHPFFLHQLAAFPVWCAVNQLSQEVDVLIFQLDSEIAKSCAPCLQLMRHIRQSGVKMLFSCMDAHPSDRQLVQLTHQDFSFIGDTNVREDLLELSGLLDSSFPLQRRYPPYFRRILSSEIDIVRLNNTIVERARQPTKSKLNIMVICDDREYYESWKNWKLENVHVFQTPKPFGANALLHILDPAVQRPQLSDT